jgi:hypothetical protein
MVFHRASSLFLSKKPQHAQRVAKSCVEALLKVGNSSRTSPVFSIRYGNGFINKSRTGLSKIGDLEGESAWPASTYKQGRGALI